MKIRRIAALLFMMMMIITTSGCVNQSADSDQSSSEDLKLIATSPAVADILDQLDLDLIGVCSTSDTLPDRYQDITQVGTAMSPDMEVIKSLSPDYVLSPSSLLSDLQPQYASIGVKSIFLNLSSVEGMFQSIQELGDKFDRQEEASAMVSDYESFIEEYKSEHDSEDAPTVLILMGLPGSYVVATENSYVGNLVKLAGGVNVYQGETDQYITANTEDMQSKNPDIILRTAHALPDEVMAMFDDEFSTNDIWQHFSAVQTGRVYDLNSELFGMSAKLNYKEALEELEPLLYGN